jgi:hypothetical protein
MKIVIAIALIVIYYIALNAMGYSISNLSAGVWAFLFMFIPLVGIPLAVTGIAAKRSQKQGFGNLHKALASEGFHPSHEIQLLNGALFIDDCNRKICVAIDETASNGEYRHFVYLADKILACSIVSDGEEITAASTSSTVGRALVGGLLFGGVGAIVGGATASRIGKEKIKSLELKLLVNDERQSSHRMRFFSNSKSVDASSILVKPHLEQIEKWQVLIELLMAGASIPALGSVQALQDHAEAVRLKAARQVGG